MRSSTPCMLAIVALLSLAGPVLAADPTYTIKLSRPDKKGDVYDITATIDSVRTTVVNAPQHEPQTDDEKLKGQVQGRVEYLEVDKKGDPTALVLTVKKVVSGDGKELLKPGQEVQIKHARAVSITLAGGDAVSDDVKKLLSELWGPMSPDAPTDDETFGSKDKHQVGDSWPINAEKAAKGLASSGIDIDAQQLSGSVSLKSADKVGDEPVLHLECQFQAKDATPVAPDPSLRVDKLNMQVNLAGTFPVDENKSPLETTEKSIIDMHMTHMTDGATISVKGTSSKTITYAQVKK